MPKPSEQVLEAIRLDHKNGLTYVELIKKYKLKSNHYVKMALGKDVIRKEYQQRFRTYKVSAVQDLLNGYFFTYQTFIDTINNTGELKALDYAKLSKIKQQAEKFNKNYFLKVRKKRTESEES